MFSILNSLNYKASSCILQEHVLGLMVIDAILGRAANLTTLIMIHVNVLTDLVEVIAQQVVLIVYSHIYNFPSLAVVSCYFNCLRAI